MVDVVDLAASEKDGGDVISPVREFVSKPDTSAVSGGKNCIFAKNGKKYRVILAVVDRAASARGSGRRRRRVSGDDRAAPFASLRATSDQCASRRCRRFRRRATNYQGTVISSLHVRNDRPVEDWGS